MTVFRRLTPAQTQRQLKYERLAGAAMATLGLIWLVLAFVSPL